MNISGEIHTRDFVQFGLPLQPSKIDAAGSNTESLGSIDEITKNHILKVLGKTGGSKIKAAKILGIARPSLYRMAKRLGIDLDRLKK